MSHQLSMMAVSIEETRVTDVLPNLEVLVGTYEEFNLGFRLTKNSEGVRFFRQHFLTISVLMAVIIFYFAGLKFYS